MNNNEDMYWQICEQTLWSVKKTKSDCRDSIRYQMCNNVSERLRNTIVNKFVYKIYNELIKNTQIPIINHILQTYEKTQDDVSINI